MVTKYLKLNAEAKLKFQTELFALIHYVASNEDDSYYADSLCAIRDAYSNSILSPEGWETKVITLGAYNFIYNGLVGLSNDALASDKDFIAEQIGDLTDLLEKAVGND